MVSSRLILFSLPLSALSSIIGPLKSRQIEETPCQQGICVLDIGPNLLENILCNAASSADANFGQDCQSIAGEAQDTLSAFTTLLAPIADTNFERPQLGFSATSGSCQLQFVLDNSFANSQSQIVTDLSSFEGILQNITQATLNEGQACTGNVFRGNSVIGTASTSVVSGNQRRSSSVISASQDRRPAIRPRQSSSGVGFSINNIGPNILENIQCVSVPGLSSNFANDCSQNLQATLDPLENDFDTEIVPLPFLQNSVQCTLQFDVESTNINVQDITDIASFSEVFSELIAAVENNPGSVCTGNVVNSETNQIVGFLSAATQSGVSKREVRRGA